MKMISSIVERVRDWYRGEYVPPRKSDPWDRVVCVGPGHYRQPLFARILNALGRFWAARWQWLIGFLVAILAILVNILLHR